ncbi:MAG: LPP20 family lipoprotein [Desulfovibrio sp.]|uniref:LPP20 family lipoprotein n=1 Tax=Desulfovibrio sp. 7SRBS1 TaxID=3378064 RepID=UPI003B3DB167
MHRLVMAVCFCVALLGVGTGISAAQQANDPGAYVQQMANGQVDWQKGLVTAIGVGAPPPNAVNMAQARAMAVRAATVVARRNLLEIVKGVQIDSQTTVENYMVTSDVVQTQVRGFLQNSQILDTAYMSDGSVEVTVGISLHGGFANVIIPPTIPFRQSPAPAPVPAPEQPQVDVPAQPAVPATPDVVYTGMLVDARGFSARPAMSPKVLDENGNEVYGSALVSREYAIQQGMAGYAKDESLAMQNPRIADHPYPVKAVNADGANRTNIVISNEEANKIRSLVAGQNFLEKCRVMILLD